MAGGDTAGAEALVGTEALLQFDWPKERRLVMHGMCSCNKSYGSGEARRAIDRSDNLLQIAAEETVPTIKYPAATTQKPTPRGSTTEVMRVSNPASRNGNPVSKCFLTFLRPLKQF